MAVPDRPDPDEIVASTWGRWAQDALAMLTNPPGCYLINSSHSAPHNASGPVTTFPTEVRDTGGFHAASAGTVVVPAGMAGLYRVTLGVQWNSVAGGGQRSILATKNGADVILIGLPPMGSARPAAGKSQVMPLAVGDSIGAYTYQDSGAALACVVELEVIMIGTTAALAP